MRVSIEKIGEDQEEEIILRCRQVDEKTVALLRQLGAPGAEVVGYLNREIHRLALKDVFYFEVVDNRSFLYCADSVYESQLKLYEFERFAESAGFFRASKSMVLNADKIDFITPSLSGRFEATLLNKEKVVVSRQYVAVLKKKMGL